VPDLRAIARRVMLAQVGPLPPVHSDRPGLAQRDPGLTRQPGAGGDTDRQDHEFGGESARPRLHLLHTTGTPVVTPFQHGIAELEIDAVRFHDAADTIGEFGIEQAEKLLAALDQAHLQAARREILGHLQPDVAAADDHGVSRGAALDVGVDGDGILHHVERENPIEIETGDSELDRCRPGRDQQLIVADDRLVATPPPHMHFAARGIDRDDLVVQLHRDRPLGELRHRARDQRGGIGHDATEPVRQSALAIGGEAAAIEGGDRQFRVAAPRLGGRAHPRRIGPDDRQTLAHHRPLTYP